MVEQCNSIEKSIRAMFDAALPCPAPLPCSRTMLVCSDFITYRFMLLYEFEILQFEEHKQTILVQRGLCWLQLFKNACGCMCEAMALAGARQYVQAV